MKAEQQSTAVFPKYAAPGCSISMGSAPYSSMESSVSSVSLCSSSTSLYFWFAVIRASGGQAHLAI